MRDQAVLNVWTNKASNLKQNKNRKCNIYIYIYIHVKIQPTGNYHCNEKHERNKKHNNYEQLPAGQGMMEGMK